MSIKSIHTKEQVSGEEGLGIISELFIEAWLVIGRTYCDSQTRIYQSST